jgi:quercetin dioxygenase-like cupin family protein
VIDVQPLGAELRNAQTSTSIKTETLEVIRLVLPAGKEIDQHNVPGEITVQCLEGKVTFRAEEVERELTRGTLIYLQGSAKHSLRAVEDSSLLLTILLKLKEPKPKEREQ